MPYHYGQAAPETAEQLMRSRYSAYFFRRIDYLVDTTHPDTREPDLKNQLENTIHEANWSFLTIVLIGSVLADSHQRCLLEGSCIGRKAFCQLIAFVDPFLVFATS